MDFAYTPEQERFRSELRDWLVRTLPPGWGSPGFAAPRTPDEVVAFGKDFQRKMFAAGYTGLAWPREYGGRGASLI